MRVPIVPLGELCEVDRQGLRPDDPNESGLPFVGVEQVESNSGAFNFNAGSRVGNQRSTTFRFDERHVLYAKLRPYLNKVATPGFVGRCSTELVPLLPRDGVDREFIAFVLRRPETVDYVMSSATGARMPRADMRALMQLRVPFPPLDEQQRIVGILNRAAMIERLRARARGLMEEFIQALFVKMFGDSIANPKGWRTANLGEICGIQGGLQVTKRRANRPIASPYLRVANVLRNELVLDEIKYIRITEGELRRVRLLSGDLLLVEGHGNAGEIGRAAVWDGSIANCVHQNHLIRARPDGVSVRPSFVCAFLNSSNGRQHLLREAKTTSGLNTITTSDVKSCPIFVPPIELQRMFEEAVDGARRVASTAKSGTMMVSTLNSSLMSLLLEKAV